MQTGLFVPGRTEEGFPPDPDYPITDRHTAYEWAMALGAEVHPYAHCIAGLFVDLTADTIPGKEARECAVETWPSVAEGEGGAEQFLPKAIYYTLKAEFETGRLEPLRREWCAERPGIDRPDVLDFSRCVFSLDQVLSLIRRRGDTGRLIDELLAAARMPNPDPDTEIQNSITEASNTAGAADSPPLIDALADWIFAQHSRRKSYKDLYDEALAVELVEFRRTDFLAAYRKVYATKPNRPPATGWPLRSPYKDCHSKSQKSL